MAKDPNRRFSSAGALASAAAAALNGKSSHSVPQPVRSPNTTYGDRTLVGAPNPTGTSMLDYQTDYAVPSPSKSRRLPYVLGTVVAVVAIAAVAIAVNADSLRGNQGSTTAAQSSQTLPAPSPEARPSPETSATTPASTVNWPGTNTIGLAPTPEFPQSLLQWTSQDSWTLTARAFPSEWSAAPGPNQSRFPSTMNGCNNQRFLVRWRALNPNVAVIATDMDAANRPGDEVTGSSGWMDLDGCRKPAFQVDSRTNPNTLSDISIAVRQFLPAP